MSHKLERTHPVGFGKHQVHPFMQVVNYLFEHFDKADIELYCSRCEQAVESDSEEDHDNEEDQNRDLQRRFYKMIDKNEDKLQCAKMLRDSLQYLNMHSEFGENFADKIQDVINQLQELEQGRKEQQQFVGRTGLITEITHQLVSGEQSNIGVVISALAGQGKSALGLQVCRELVEDHGWTICRVPPRGKTTTKEMAASNTLSSQDSSLLTEKLKNKIKTLEHNTLFFLDDCEKVMEKDKFDELLYSLLKTVARLGKNAPKIKFLITSRTKVSTWGLEKLASTLEQIDLGPLDDEEAMELLKMASGKLQDIDQEAGEIVFECASSPLAVIKMAEVLKVGKLNPGNLVFHLKNDKKNVTSALAVGNYIDATIKLLPEEFQKELVRLSVFQSGTFSKSSAKAVVANRKRVSKTLEMLCDHHLITKDSSMYSLQALVYRYIQEQKKPEHLTKANRQFVKLFERKINKIVIKLYTKKFLKGIKKLEKYKQHILRFYDLLETNNDMDTWDEVENGDKVKTEFVLTKKRVSELADHLLSNAKKRRLFKRKAERAQKSQCDAMYIFWQVEEADLYVSLADKADIAEEMLDTLAKDYPSLEDPADQKVYPALVHALYHMVKGWVCKQQQQLEEAVDQLYTSLKFFKNCKSDSINFLKARTYSKLCQVYIEQKEYDLAEKVLKKGFRLLSIHPNVAAEFEHATNNGASNRGLAAVKPAAEDIDRLEQWDASLFHTLFGNIQLARAKETDPSNRQRETYLDQAQQHFLKGIKLDIFLKMDRLDCFCEKLDGVAEVYIARGKFMKALTYAKISCDLRREIIQPPHIVFTLAVYLLAHVYQLIGNQFEEEGKQEEARSYWTTARDYFRELEQHHLINGGIRTDHPKFAEIKYNHFCLAKSIRDDSYSKKVKKLYWDIECGHYMDDERSFLDRFKKMTLTPMKTIRNWFGAGGREFGERDHVLQVFEAETEDQDEEMMRQAEEADGGYRYDYGNGACASSVSSASGRLSYMHSATTSGQESKPQAEQVKFKQNKKRHRTDRTE